MYKRLGVSLLAVGRDDAKSFDRTKQVARPPKRLDPPFDLGLGDAKRGCIEEPTPPIRQISDLACNFRFQSQISISYFAGGAGPYLQGLKCHDEVHEDVGLGLLVFGGFAVSDLNL